MAAAVNVSAFLDRQRFGRHHLTVLSLAAALNVIDSFDVYVVAFVLVPMAEWFKTSPAALTPMLVAQQLGLTLSAYAIGPLADRFGRRLTTLIHIGAFGILTLALPFMPSIALLAVARFFGGLALGAVITNANTLMFEISPRSRRSVILATIGAFSSLSVFIAAGVSLLLIHRLGLGWQSVFVVGGIAPLVLLPLFIRYLPESPRYRIARDPKDPRIAAELRRFDSAIAFAPGTTFEIDELPSAHRPLAQLFRDGRARETVMSWIMLFGSGLIVVMVGQYFPTFLHTLGGISLASATMVFGLFAAGGVVSTPLLGYCMDRYGARRVIVGVYACGTVALALLGLIDVGTLPAFAAVAIVVGGLVPTSLGLMNAFTPTLYPTRIRNTGSAWAIGAARIGGIIAPLVGGIMLASRWSLSQVFFTLAGVFLAGFLAACFLRRPAATAAPAPAPATAS